MSGGAPTRCAAFMLASAIMLAWSSTALAGDPEAGRIASRGCVPCHGSDGLSKRPDAPNIAGQIPLYMTDQLRKYRSGERAHEIMNIVARTLSDEDIDNLVAYYSGLRITVEAPE